MSNVYISQQAIEDMNAIFHVLMTWQKGKLEISHALRYVDDIENECYSIAFIPKHFSTTYIAHKQYGEKVHKYRRNANTTWYIIYNMDIQKNIFINKIISNYTTAK